MPVQQFYHSLVEGTRYNMLVHPEVSGNVTANLKDVTMVEALDAIREMYGYDYRIEGTRISIKPLTMQTRVFQVNYLIGSRKGTSSLRVVSTSVSNSQSGNNNNQNNQNGQNNNNNNNNQNGSGSTQQDSSVVNTTSNSEFWAELKLALDAIVGGGTDGRAVVISPQSGVVVVRGMPEELRNVDAYLEGEPAVGQPPGHSRSQDPRSGAQRQLPDGDQLGRVLQLPRRHAPCLSGLLQPGTTLTPGNGAIGTNGPPGMSAVAGSLIKAADGAA
ncbi:secretin N-terminal domain-containing protein [Massilia sp. B-10]|nr:secretin N-terminal domain-containing protein [Massilia sp. B-10]